MLRNPLFSAVLALALAACVPPEDPAQAYRTFSDTLQKGEATKAWGMLSKATRDELTRAARASAQARRQPPPDNGIALAFGDVLFARKVRRAEVKAISGDHAQVLVTDEREGQETVSLVREGGAWRVDLSAELAQAVSP